VDVLLDALLLVLFGMLLAGADCAIDGDWLAADWSALVDGLATVEFAALAELSGVAVVEAGLPTAAG